jgi:WD40 repeat protein
VTSIVDLQDNQSLVSGSYDKKINIYNLLTGKISFNLPANKSSVTGIILNNVGNKMISCGLDSYLTVWQVVRNTYGVV